MNLRLTAANTNDASPAVPRASSRGSLLLEWLTRLRHPGFSCDPLPILSKCVSAIDKGPRADDWNAVTNICGYTLEDFFDAGAPLPLYAAEIDYIRRNHRGAEHHLSRDFRTAQTGLPSPLAELYGLYRQRASIDAEAALWVAQSTNSVRVASLMADMLAIGAFANGLEYVNDVGVSYSIPCAFDSSAEIDCANREAIRRLALPVDHPSHLLKLKPDELGVLAASIAERNALSPGDFLEKANLLSEARQDVTRLPARIHFSTVIVDRDLPMQTPWVARLVNAYARIFPEWIMGLPEVQALLA